MSFSRNYRIGDTGFSLFLTFDDSLNRATLEIYNGTKKEVTLFEELDLVDSNRRYWRKNPVERYKKAFATIAYYGRSSIRGWTGLSWLAVIDSFYNLGEFCIARKFCINTSNENKNVISDYERYKIIKEYYALPKRNKANWACAGLTVAELNDMEHKLGIDVTKNEDYASLIDSDKEDFIIETIVSAKLRAQGLVFKEWSKDKINAVMEDME